MTQITPSLQEITCGDATKTLEELPQAQLRILCLQVKSPARRNDRGWGVFAKSVDAGRDASRGCPGVNIRERVRMGFQRDIQGATRRNVDGAARRIIHLLASRAAMSSRRKTRPSNWSPSWNDQWNLLRPSVESTIRAAALLQSPLRARLAWIRL